MIKKFLAENDNEKDCKAFQKAINNFFVAMKLSLQCEMEYKNHLCTLFLIAEDNLQDKITNYYWLAQGFLFGYLAQEGFIEYKTKQEN